jgi:GNAT superfamily N-acetyltransferase
MSHISGNIQIHTVRTKRDVSKFIKMVWPLYRDHSKWVPPLLIDRRMILDTNKNPFYRHAEIEMFIAYNNGEIAGRIAAILNRNHNEFHDENIGFFGFFESVDNQAVTTALVEKAKDWLRDKGVTAMRGPMNPSTNDDIGILIDGFDKSPAIMMTYNPPYYDRLLKEAGLEKIKDIYAYYVHKDKVLSEKFRRVMEKLKERDSIKIRQINMKEFPSELERVKTIYNNAWSRNWGFIPMTDAEFDYLAVSMKQIIDPRVVLFAEDKGKPVGFGLSVPDVNQILIHNKKGWLLPAVVRLILKKKKINFLRIIVLGVRTEYQGSSVAALLLYETAIRGIANGYYHGEASWVLEDNTMMNKAATFMNADRYKTYRIYETSL